MVNYNVFNKVGFLFIFISIAMQSCYLFFLLRPENAFEEVLEKIVEEEFGVQQEEAPVAEDSQAERS